MDLAIISGDFFYDSDLPREKKYLYKYFPTKAQRLFVRYFLLFGQTRRFVDHTGCYVTSRYLRKMKNKFRRLEKEYKAAKLVGDIEKIALLESGNFKLAGLLSSEPEEPATLLS